MLLRVGRSMRLGTVLVRIQDTTAEIRVRFAVLLLVALVALAGHLGLETILGAFLAGAVVGLVDRDSSTHPHFRIKLDAIGYGFLIPVFFISSGVRLDLSGLLASPSALLRVPLFLLALLVVRGVPAPLSIRRLGRPAVGRVRAAAGDVPSVHRHGQPDGGGGRIDDTDHRRGARMRRPAVRPHLPGARPGPAAIRTHPPHGNPSGLRREPNPHGSSGSDLTRRRQIVPEVSRR